MTLDVPHMALHGYAAAVRRRLEEWDRIAFARRLWAKDGTLWSPTPVPELDDRLGWLILPEAMRGQAAALRRFGEDVAREGMRHVVVLGMGGSSLAPEVFQRTYGNSAGRPELIVLDSTHPDAVRAVESRIDVSRTLFLVSSKSGTTVETTSLFQYFWHRVGDVSSRGQHFVAITDRGTPLAGLADERGFRRTFDAPADVGGRYSALTVFGLVPAALIGVDIDRLLERARSMAEKSGPSVACSENPALVLGAALGELALAGRDKVTFLASPALESLPSWIEQLIAESTGKDGKGIVPVVDEPSVDPRRYGGDRFFVFLGTDSHPAGDLDGRADALEAAGHPVARIRLADHAELGGEFLRWQIAVASAGAVLGIHPFNQPDVQLAKELAQRAIEDRGTRPSAKGGDAEISATDRTSLADALRVWTAAIRPGHYLAIQAYLSPSTEISAGLGDIRGDLLRRLRVATTVGCGPRFLHSTGQLHKGGPNTGHFLQLVDEPVDDLAVPEAHYTFGSLIAAQAFGDLGALRQRGRHVIRLQLGQDAPGGLRKVAEALRA